MTRQRVAQTLKKLAGQLGLASWNFELLIEESATSEHASCEAKPEYLYAKITVNLAKIGPDDIHDYLVHELLHCHVWELANLAETLATTVAEKEAIRVAEERLTTSLERIVAPRVMT